MASASVYRVAAAATELAVAQAFGDLLGTEAFVDESRGDTQWTLGLTAPVAAGALEIQLNNIARFGLGLPKGG